MGHLEFFENNNFDARAHRNFGIGLLKSYLTFGYLACSVDVKVQIFVVPHYIYIHMFFYIKAHRGLVFLILYIYSIHCVICHPSDRPIEERLKQKTRQNVVVLDWGSIFNNFFNCFKLNWYCWFHIWSLFLIFFMSLGLFGTFAKKK